ncbi:hypothetical protein [Arsenophonus sp.]|nr:hypothetical protein [Arsenophonus sp.]MDR5617695.1 hypothetical protein [Arsenophonus sp.]
METKSQQSVKQERAKENTAQQVQQQNRNATGQLDNITVKLKSLMMQISEGQSQALRAATPAA